MFDTTIVHPAAKSNVRHALQGKIGGAARNGERAKLNKYGIPAEEQEKAFIPCAIETGGTFGPCARNLVTSMANMATTIDPSVDHLPKVKARIATHIRHVIATALQGANADMQRRWVNSLRNRKR